MTLKKRIILDIEMTSGASEADLSLHLNEFCSSVLSKTQDEAQQSWWRSLLESYEEERPVEIEVEATVVDVPEEEEEEEGKER